MNAVDVDTRIRGRLIQVVTKLARAVQAGEALPEKGELVALVSVLEEHRLPIEALRVRRWIKAAGR